MNLKALLYLSFFSAFICSCQSDKKSSKYLRHIGDIEYDGTMDKPDFFLCNEKDIIQYHNNSNGLEYKDEKQALQQEIFSNYTSVPDSSQNGLIRIRFVVNYRGETDRFRVIAMDEDYQEKQFREEVTEQLLLICKDLKGWLPKTMDGNDVDYYQYLIFKIYHGNLIEIMP